MSIADSYSYYVDGGRPSSSSSYDWCDIRSVPRRNAAEDARVAEFRAQQQAERDEANRLYAERRLMTSRSNGDTHGPQ
jgi:hypothetical protein